MRHDCRGGNWHMKIVAAIENASADDILLVATAAARESAEGARDRMRPRLELRFEVEQPPDPFL